MTKPCQGPEPARRPRRAAPEGACDCHAHILGPFDAYPLQAERAYTPPPAFYEDYRAMLDTIGIARAVIVQPSVYGTDNRCTLAAIARDPDRMRGIAVFGDDVTDAEIGRIHAPIGLNIGASTPAEIAVAVLAEIIGALRRTRAAEKAAA